jgi:hypothetical protein
MCPPALGATCEREPALAQTRALDDLRAPIAVGSESDARGRVRASTR